MKLSKQPAKPANLSPHLEQENNVLVRMLKAKRGEHPIYKEGKVVRIMEGETYLVGALGRIVARFAFERVLLLSLLSNGKHVYVPEWLCDVPKGGAK